MAEVTAATTRTVAKLQQGQDKIKVMHFSDEHHAHQIAAGSVLNLWEERKAQERTQAEDRRRKSSLGSDGDAQQAAQGAAQRPPKTGRQRRSSSRIQLWAEARIPLTSRLSPSNSGKNIQVELAPATADHGDKTQGSTAAGPAPEQEQVPCMTQYQGAVLIADITGFTALTEDLGRRGTAGVELLTRCMNNFFTLVIQTVVVHGGDVMRFAGDSMICAFLPTPKEAASHDQGLAAATLRSVQCAWALAESLGSMRMLMDGKVAPVPKTERVQPQMPSRGSVDRGSDSTPLWRRTLRMSTDTQPRSNALEAFDRHSKRGEALGSQGASQPSREGPSGWRARHLSLSSSQGASQSIEKSDDLRRAQSSCSSATSSAASIGSLPSGTSSQRQAAQTRQRSNSAGMTGMLQRLVSSRRASGHGTQDSSSPFDSPTPWQSPRVSDHYEAHSPVRHRSEGEDTQTGTVHVISKGSPIVPRPRGLSEGTEGSQLRVSRLHPDGAPASPFIKRSLPVASVVRAPSEPPSAPEAAAESSAKQKLAPGLHSLAASKKQAEPEESFGGVPLEAYFRQTSIAAHRPPHIPVMRTVAEVNSEDPGLAPVSSLETASSVGSIASNMANVPSLDVKWDVTTSKFVSSAPGSLSHREISQFVKQRLEGPAPGAQDIALLVDTAVGDRIRTQLRTLYKDSLNIRKAERIAAARASLMSMPESKRAKINPFRSDNSLSLGARSGSFGTDVPKIQKRTSVQLVGPIVKEASLAIEPALPRPKAPEPSHLLAEMEPLTRWGPGPVAESISDDKEVPPVSSMAAVDEVPTEQIAEAPTAAAGSRRATRASGGWGFDWLLKRRSKDRASRVKSRGSLMPRRWSSVQMNKSKEDRRSSLPVLRTARRVSNYAALRERRWSTAVWKSLLPTRKERPDSANASRRETQNQDTSASRQNIGSKRPPRSPPPRVSNHTLSLKVAVGCGNICAFHVGGTAETESSLGRWEFFIGDHPHLSEGDGERQPVEQISLVEGFLEAGEVGLSAEVIAQGLATEGEAKSDGFEDFMNLGKDVRASALDVLRMHLPDSLAQRIEAGHLAFINEIRRPTTSSMDPITSVQAAIEVVQRIMKQHEGSFLQLRCDEKGFLSICAFGLPGKAHEDDPSRGIRAAIDIVNSLEKIQEEGVVGVTTGQLLCACVGSDLRSEYTVYGDAVNLRARLMVKAASGLGSVLCDYTTHQLGAGAAAFVKPEPIKVKGKAFPLDVFIAAPKAQDFDMASMTEQQLQPQAKLSSSKLALFGVAATARHRPIIGAENALAKIYGRVDSLVEAAEGGCILIEGDAGMGKSRLMEEIQRSNLGGNRDAITMLFSSADFDHRGQAMYPWRRVFKGLFQHDRAHGQLYSMRRRDGRGRPMVVSKLGKRLADAEADWRHWTKSLAGLLEVLEDEMPTLPAANAQVSVEPGIKAGPKRQRKSLAHAVPLLGHPSKSMPMMQQQSMPIFKMPDSAKPIGNPFAGFAETAVTRLDSYQKQTSQRTVSDLLAETVSSSMHRSASQGALEGRSTSLQKAQEAEPIDVREGSNSTPINPDQYAQSKGMQTPDRSALQGSIARYASGMKSRMSQRPLPTGADAVQMPSLWSREVSKSPMPSVSTPRVPQKSALHGALANLLRGQKGLRDAKRAAALMAQPPLTQQNSLANIASNMKAASGEALSRAHSRQAAAEQQPSQPQQQLRGHSASRQPVQASAFSTTGLSVHSRDSSCSGFNFFGGANSSPGSSEAGGPRTAGILNFSAATLQRPPVLDMSAATSRRTSDSSMASSTRVSQSGAPPQPHLARSSSSPAPVPAAARSDELASSAPRRRTLQGEDEGSLERTLHMGFHSRQALTPIRSGEVESFKRPTQSWQPLRSAFGDAALHETIDVVSWPSESEVSTACPSPANRSSRLSDTAGKLQHKRSGDGGPLERIKRMCSSPLVGHMLGRLASGALPKARRPRGLSDTKTNPDGGPETPASIETGELQLGFSAPAGLHEACDAAIAALSMQQAPPQPKSMLRKASRSTFGSLFLRKQQSSALQPWHSPLPDVMPHVPSQTQGSGSAARMKGPQGLLSRAALREALTSSPNAFASARNNESLHSQEDLRQMSSPFLTFATFQQQADIKASKFGQVLRTRSTSLDSMAGSRTSGRGLRRSETTINVDHSHTLGGMPHAKELLILALREWTKVYGPLVVLLENFDRADALSWSLLSRCAEEIDMPVMVIVAVRPNDGVFASPLPGQAAKAALHAKMSTLLEDIRENPFTLRMVLQPFTPEHTQAFLNAALDGVLVSSDVAHNLWEKTGGLPLYIEQHNLWEKIGGMPLYIEQMVVYMQQHQAGREGAVEQADLSAFIRNTVTIHSLITDRVDRLRPSQQLTLKVASVMGMSVSLDLLLDMYPIATSREALQRDLIDLEAARFLRATDVPGTWMMTQVLARDVAYELIPFSQRRALHADLARALEEDGRAGCVPATILAYHWTHSCAGVEAGEWRRALQAVWWWERAAHAAQEEGIDPSEALRLFQRADEIAAVLKASYRARSQTQLGHKSLWPGHTRPSSHLVGPSFRSSGWSSMVVHPVRRAQWQRCMAACGLALGDLDNARRHALQALHHLGAPLPSDPSRRSFVLRSWLALGPLGCLSGPANRRVSADGSDEVDISLVGDFAAWVEESATGSGQTPLEGTVDDTEEDWQGKRMQEAARVLGLLVKASLMLTPVDVDALKYICATAASLQGKRIWGRVPQTSLLYPVMSECRAALLEASPQQHRSRFFRLK
ncbi:hypothetical protein COCSUDRAFT_56833 [Coccomyxa subellipsoidea C-169]|uniref:Guanylate cyclase domain-containing protein n=1 Tax=Coccomyxa subellipsoidea (strain C-169) TaxID=574566 RepID=I0YTB1_COCSC|nr:hypothetical protein COCSUDRAFT_56833 [Coccomyxa subellipsoidea C-169]EIE21630.1 hypothetical protein COCSUDRAFT_56833 [Coccomyxa subellipsoidea C-169]|eukprot:XP_005646174.1 hypothetical protein COCSUDRAFT_56833 [Coccomyxa subellipsoidea C-169]